MSVTEIHTAIPRPSRVPAARRLAQALLLVPLGAFQLVAAIAFTVADGVRGAELAVSGWAVAMAAAGIVVGLRLGRGGAAVERAATVLLAAQAAFAVVKLAVYHESASFVFLAIVAATAALLHASRRAAPER